MPSSMSLTETLVSAALRHVRDAEFLASPGSHRSTDQAYHLAGFGPECARKATLSFHWADLALGHGFDDRLLEMVVSLDTRAHRYRPLGWRDRFPALEGWGPQCRYKATGTYTEVVVAPLVAEARRAVDKVVLALWADGRLPRGAFL